MRRVLERFDCFHGFRNVDFLLLHDSNELLINVSQPRIDVDNLHVNVICGPLGGHRTVGGHRTLDDVASRWRGRNIGCAAFYAVVSSRGCCCNEVGHAHIFSLERR